MQEAYEGALLAWTPKEERDEKAGRRWSWAELG